MNAKYFTAETQDEAEDLASQFFSCEKSEITFEVISHDDGSPWQLLAMTGTNQEIVNKNASFKSVWFRSLQCS